MQKKLKVKINPQILKILRENSGFSINEVSEKIPPLGKDIQEIEEKGIVSIYQIKKLSELYRYSTAAFFSNTVSPLASISDYRINRDKNLTPQIFQARKAAYYISNIIKSLSGKISKIPDIQHISTIKNQVEKIRSGSDFSIPKNKKPSVIFQYYKDMVEEEFFIPVIEYPLKANDVRALSIYSDISVIVLNESDTLEIKTFSIFHELCHLLYRISSLCSIEIDFHNQHLESHCNKFAAEFLVPYEDLKTEIENLGIDEFNQEDISRLSKVYGVSKQVIMLRLLELGYIENSQYSDFQNRFKEITKKQSKGFRNWEQVYQNRVGNLVLRETGNALSKGSIDINDIAMVLNVKTKYLYRILKVNRL